jgi:4-hydroxy-3-methylbut-2-enyl diphosphate reductase
MSARTIKRAEKYGFCSGVRIADLKVKRFAAGGGRGAVLGQIVHNERVVAEMETLGVRTVEEAVAVDWSRYPKIKVFYQTTLNAEEFEDVVQTIERRAAKVERADTICYATKQNQDAARLLAHDPEVDLIVVIGGTRSANTKHLWEICRESKPSYLVQGAEDLDPEWFRNAKVVGVTAGASTPDYVIDEVEARIAALTPA